MRYDDLLGVPYKKDGREIKTGLDCYGLAIECFRRVGKNLKDISATPNGDLSKYISSINAKEIHEYRIDCGAQFLLNGDLHIGFMLDSRTVLHMTDRGVRLTPIIALGKARLFEVINDSDAL